MRKNRRGKRGALGGNLTSEYCLFFSYESQQVAVNWQVLEGRFRDAKVFERLDADSRAGFTSSRVTNAMDLGIKTFLLDGEGA